MIRNFQTCLLVLGISATLFSSQFYTLQSMAARYYFHARDIRTQIELLEDLGTPEKTELLTIAQSLLSASEFFEKATLNEHSTKALLERFYEAHISFHQLQNRIWQLGISLESLSRLLAEEVALAERIFKELEM